MPLDAIDQRILAALQRDARLSFEQLAERVGLSSSAVLRRVRRLEGDGVIAGYSALVAPASAHWGILWPRVKRVATGSSSEKNTSWYI